MHLDSQKGYLDKLGQLKKSKLFVIKINEIDPLLGHLDIFIEEHIGEIKVSGLQAI